MRRRIHKTSSSCGNEGSSEEVAEIVRVTDTVRDRVLCIVDGCLYMYIFTSYNRGLVILISIQMTDTVRDRVLRIVDDCLTLVVRYCQRRRRIHDTRQFVTESFVSLVAVWHQLSGIISHYQSICVVTVIFQQTQCVLTFIRYFVLSGIWCYYW